MPLGTRNQRKVRLDRSQVHAAHTLYRGGFSVPEIADMLWREKQFSSKESCMNSLYAAFRYYRLPTRNYTEANDMRRLKEGCKACGGDIDSFTVGCSACQDRRWWRKNRRKSSPRPRIRTPIARSRAVRPTS